VKKIFNLFGFVLKYYVPRLVAVFKLLGLTKKKSDWTSLI
jgi:hypothetical protein